MWCFRPFKTLGALPLIAFKRHFQTKYCFTKISNPVLGEKNCLQVDDCFYMSGHRWQTLALVTLVAVDTLVTTWSQPGHILTLDIAKWSMTLTWHYNTTVSILYILGSGFFIFLHKPLHNINCLRSMLEDQAHFQWVKRFSGNNLSEWEVGVRGKQVFVS